MGETEQIHSSYGLFGKVTVTDNASTDQTLQDYCTVTWLSTAALDILQKDNCSYGTLLLTIVVP